VSGVWCCVGCCGAAVVVAGVVVVIGVTVEYGANGGGDGAVASLALASPISPHHLRNISCPL